MSSEVKNNNQNNNTKYTPHSIDNLIVRTMESIDKSNFGVKDKIFFFKELSYLISGGVGLMDAIKLVYQNSTDFAVKEIAKKIGEYLNEGKTLSYALSRLPEYFDDGDCSIIKSGEKSGNLTIILKALSTEYSYINTIKNKYTGALMYPMILVVMAVAAVLGLFIFVLPGIFSIIDTFQNVNLPLVTRILKGTSDFLLNNRRQLGIGTVLVVLTTSAFFSTNTGKKAFYAMIMSMPLIGNMTKKFYLIKRCRYMKIMFSAGMNYVDTFKLLRDILGIPAYQEMIERVLAGLQRGESIYNSLKNEHDLIPSNVASLIRVGEESANLEMAIENVLNIYDEELNESIDRLGKIIEPFMLVFIGAIVIVIALGVFGLIFQIMESVSV